MSHDVIYPGGVTVSDAMHTALQAIEQHPQGGAHSAVSEALAVQANAEVLVPLVSAEGDGPNDVLYPGGVVVSDALHSVLYNTGAQPQNGQHSAASLALAEQEAGGSVAVDPNDHASIAALAMHADDATITDPREVSQT